ncbi:50S ribosomal protein L13 [Candidatus Curtissbacteria bacterium]|nr:50S ribosomal protein L13 [Candidatus Curtissbacteria bacterium]
MKNVKPKDIKRNWHLLDAKNKILGRLASEISLILMGKNKSYYTPYLDTGDYVVVINAKEIVFSGKKERQKQYWHHSQYPGGMHVKSVSVLRNKKPEELIRHAVGGMIPKTKLGKDMMKKLFIFSNSNHPYQDKFATTEKPDEHPGGESGSKMHAKSGPPPAVAIK